MDKFIVDGLDIFNPLGNRMSEIIDSFVKFYGEEYRPRIEEKLKNVKIYFLAQDNLSYNNALAYDIRDYFSRKRKEVEVELWTKLIGKNCGDIARQIGSFNLDFSIEHIYQQMKLDADAEAAGAIGDFLMIVGYNMPNNYTGRCEKAKEMLQDKNFRNKIFSKVKQLREAWKSEDYRVRCQELMEQKKDVLEQVGSTADFKKKIETDIASKIQALYDLHIANHIPDYDKLNAFEKNELKGAFISFLQGGKFVSKTIKMSHINLFKRMGISHGTYEKYLQDERVKEIFNDDLRQAYKDIQKDKNRQLLYNPMIQGVLNDLEKQGKVYGINLIARGLHTFVYAPESMSAYMQYMKLGENFMPICVLPHALKLNDSTLIHELTHVIDADVQITGESVYIKSGFEKLCVGTDNDPLDADIVYGDNAIISGDSRGHRKFEYLNEVVVDYFASQTYKIFKEDHERIGHGEPSITTYSLAFPLLGEFIEDNKELLIKGKMTGDHEIFAKTIGQDAYERLTDCVNRFLSFDSNRRESAYQMIEKKTGLNMPEDLKYLVADKKIKWEGDEKFIVDCYKEIEEISHKVKERRLEYESQEIAERE